MQPHKIHEAISRKPVFGDVQQIMALRMMRKEEDEKEAAKEKGKNEYRVRVSYSVEDTVTVWAKDESEAKMLAREEIDVEDGEFDYTVKKVG